jgi:hypothetical protein
MSNPHLSNVSSDSFSQSLTETRDEDFLDMSNLNSSNVSLDSFSQLSPEMLNDSDSNCSSSDSSSYKSDWSVCTDCNRCPAKCVEFHEANYERRRLKKEQKEQKEKAQSEELKRVKTLPAEESTDVLTGL